jgi:phospholipid transport system substrate-binding protein
MRFPKALFLLIALACFSGAPSWARAEQAAAPAAAKDLYDALLTSMKKGASMNFAARRDMLTPVIQRDYNLPLMTRFAVGSIWQSMAPENRRKLVEAFSAYSIATYARRFDGYSGERFEVDPVAAPLPGGDCIVHTKLFTGDPDPIQLDYRMRKTADCWRIIDVYLSGTISEIAARRSEYSTILRQGGAPALIELLTKKTADLANQPPGSS